MSFPFNVCTPEWVKSQQHTCVHNLSPSAKRIQSVSPCSVLPLLSAISILPQPTQHAADWQARWNLWGKKCNNNNNNTSHPKTGNESDLWLLIIGTVHFGLIRQWDRRGTSIPPDMKYGGNICSLLLEDPDSVMIQQAMSDKNTHTLTKT